MGQSHRALWVCDCLSHACGLHSLVVITCLWCSQPVTDTPRLNRMCCWRCSSSSCSRPLALNTCQLSDARKRTKNVLRGEKGILKGGNVAPVLLLSFFLIIIHSRTESIFGGSVLGGRVLGPKNWLVCLKKSATDGLAYCNECLASFWGFWKSIEQTQTTG